MQSSCLLCISTLLESSNHYSKMFELKDPTTDIPLFETIQISLVCDACAATETPEKCTHKLADMPRWLSSKKLEVVKSLLADDPAMLLRESMGVSADATSKAFSSNDVKAFMARQPVAVNDSKVIGIRRDDVSHVVVAVDPSGGGSSAFAVCSTCQLNNGRLLVLGIDTLKTKDVRETHRVVVEHMNACRAIPGLRDCVVVLCLESNLAFESQHILHAIQKQGMQRWIALQEGAGGTLGWLTTNERKEAMCLQLREALAVGNLSFSASFFSTTQTVAEARAQLKDELCNFCVLVEPSKTPFGKVKKTYSGKIGGRQDDLAIALQLAVTGLRCFFQSEKYGKYRAVPQ